MKKFILLFSLVPLAIVAFSQELHQNIYVKLAPSTGEILVIDSLKLPKGLLNANHSIQFDLNKNLKPSLTQKNVLLTLVSDKDSLTNRYTLSSKNSKEDVLMVSLLYQGIINDEIKTGAADYARGFSETDGMICSEGVYLAGATNWVPNIKGVDLYTFTLTTVLDETWNVVSQGTRIQNVTSEGLRTVCYNSPDPMDEVYLIAAKWTEYSINAGDVLVQAFLRRPDEKLANRYLENTSQYLSMYENLIGPYPFTKFALVENFWETGYGMPSFTLLGQKVIRFPWILYSSYPHELLHNYWGNSVYVDYDKGNWCEGITAYMADHLLKEQQGEGAEYRRTTLQKYTDYVNDENDFPIARFLSRNNSAEEAIGYGKTMMVNNMLREKFGDEVFKKAYSKFYTDYKFSYASFDDIRTCFESVTGKDLKPFFDQWIMRTGAPSLKISDVESKSTGSEYELSFKISQIQKEDIFNLEIPIVVYLENRSEVLTKKIGFNSRESKIDLKFTQRPLKVSLDPEFQVMRRLDRSEVPTTLSQMFGYQESIVIIPENSPLKENYLAIAGFWKTTQEVQGNEMEIISDKDLNEFPKDKAVWVMGFENKFYSSLKISDTYMGYLTESDVEKFKSVTTNGALVYTLPDPVNGQLTSGFVGINKAESAMGLASKLLHYGKYGYLGFEGTAPDNVLKGIFPALGSKLEVVIDYPDHPVIQAKITPRPALIQ